MSLSGRLCERVGPCRCPQAFVQLPVGSTLALEFFQKEKKELLNLPVLYILSAPCPRNSCTSAAMTLTTDGNYLLDHSPGLSAFWGRGACLTQATPYPQCWAMPDTQKLCEKCLPNGRMHECCLASVEYPSSASLRLPLPGQDVLGPDWSHLPTAPLWCDNKIRSQTKHCDTY